MMGWLRGRRNSRLRGLRRRRRAAGRGAVASVVQRRCQHGCQVIQGGRLPPLPVARPLRHCHRWHALVRLLRVHLLRVLGQGRLGRRRRRPLRRQQLLVLLLQQPLLLLLPCCRWRRLLRSGCMQRGGQLLLTGGSFLGKLAHQGLQLTLKLVGSLPLLRRGGWHGAR